ncbi:MAG: hypothetical protein QXT43_02585, partial [Candidatus Micrarchaeaceae archaeon]
LAGSLGKRSEDNGMLFFNRKERGINITVLAANPQVKYYVYAQIAMLASVIVLSSKNVDALFGEMLVASSLLGKKVIITDDSEVSGLLNGLSIDYEVVPREALLSKLVSFSPLNSQSGFSEVNIDRAFPVNGVGDVALGIVTHGSVRKHDVLFHNSGTQVTIRSIQILDEDTESADEGTRVGISLKGIKYDEIERGDVLASNQVKPVKSFKARINMSRFVKGSGAEGRWQFVKNFSVSNATVEKSEDALKIDLDKAVPLKDGDSFLLVRNEIPRIAASGTVVLS